MNIIIEALSVGIVVALVGYLVNMLPCMQSIDKKYSLIVILFVTGAVSHLTFEAAGLNTWYCKHGTACR
mgnify:FL=1|jgi:hypothetical protein